MGTTTQSVGKMASQVKEELEEYHRSQHEHTLAELERLIKKSSEDIQKESNEAEEILKNIDRMNTE